jgi:hypothetical protein
VIRKPSFVSNPDFFPDHQIHNQLINIIFISKLTTYGISLASSAYMANIHECAGIKPFIPINSASYLIFICKVFRHDIQTFEPSLSY